MSNLKPHSKVGSAEKSPWCDQDNNVLSRIVLSASLHRKCPNSSVADVLIILSARASSTARRKLLFSIYWIWQKSRTWNPKMGNFQGKTSHERQVGIVLRMYFVWYLKQFFWTNSNSAILPNIIFIVYSFVCCKRESRKYEH